MKVGDLVKPSYGHGLRGKSYRAHGLIIKYLPKSGSFQDGVIVKWNDGDIELEIPGWLEVISENQ